MAVTLTRWPSAAGPAPERAGRPEAAPPPADPPIYAALVREWSRAGRATPCTGRGQPPLTEPR